MQFEPNAIRIHVGNTNHTVAQDFANIFNP